MSTRKFTNHERMNFRAALETRRLELSGQLSGRIRQLSRQQRRNDGLYSTPCITDREHVAGMLNRFSSALANVERALRALEEGCYGDCIRCVTPIPMKRLQTTPWAAFCERCQADIQALRNSVSAPDFDGPRAA